MNGPIFNNPNFNPNFNNPTITVLPPIITRRTNVVNRYFVIEQPHICEDETQYINHYIKRHNYITKPICCQKNVYTEENQTCPNGFNNNQFASE